MKKITLSAIVATTLLLTSANAGVILDFEAGVGTWNATPSGFVNYKGTTVDMKNNLGLESSNNTYLYADFNHFIPIVPNLRVEKQDLIIDSKSVGTINWNGTNISTGSKTELDLSQQDIILYWGIPGLNLLTAGILDVNFGLDIKRFDGSITVNNDPAELSFSVPMAYLAATIDPPFIPATISASYKNISYKDSKLNEVMAKASINLPIPIPLIDIKADIGYKALTLTIDESLSDSLTADIKFSGMFFGISAKF